ncbi:MAG: DUF4147 domain-containing protein [Erysipelotrichaceae bacterium]|nr:DUF4147 domain-containing protein [Erysipelotrichaceae bacterium]
MLSDALKICLGAIDASLPKQSVKDTLSKLQISGDIYLVAVGKASFAMAEAAGELLNIKRGIVLSKYGHIKGTLPDITSYEAGHPVTDENGILATREIIRMCSDLKEEDNVLFLLSGGASALFEEPLIPLKELQDLNEQMLRKGLDINEINTLRKRLSKVKGGRFYQLCQPARVYSLILSDVLGDRLDSIGSGPTVQDHSKREEALSIIGKYGLVLSKQAMECIHNSDSIPVDEKNVSIIGSVKLLAQKAIGIAKDLGYRPVLLSDHIAMEAKEAGDYLYSEIQCHRGQGKIALIMTGETVVHVKGNGLGGRNQELVLSQVAHLRGMDGVLIVSLGSDGTDGPTDAAGAYADRYTHDRFIESGIDYPAMLENNDSYHALKQIDALIKTGPTGTNVNDITIALIEQ